MNIKSMRHNPFTEGMKEKIMEWLRNNKNLNENSIITLTNAPKRKVLSKRSP
jgi:hypothetical protein